MSDDLIKDISSFTGWGFFTGLCAAAITEIKNRIKHKKEDFPILAIGAGGLVGSLATERALSQKIFIDGLIKAHVCGAGVALGYIYGREYIPRAVDFAIENYNNIYRNIEMTTSLINRYWLKR